jgi:hypothetical protein
MSTIFRSLGAILFLFSTASYAEVAQTEEQSQVQPENAPLALTVFKSPSCGCCGKWVQHIHNEGFNAVVKDTAQLSAIKRHYQIAPRYQSCHTAVSRDGYVFEGHIPARYIQKFIDNPVADAIGLTVPAMPVGSPGMEVGERFQPYQILLLHRDGTHSPYAQIDTYEEQF